MLLKENALRKERVTSKKAVYYVYYFKCSGCEREIKCQPQHLKKHSGKCLSCVQLGEPYMFIYNELKNHRRRDVDFVLTFEEFKEIIKNPICYYCDIELVYNKHSRNWGKSLSRAHQLDRKDNNKGYTKDNVVPCCWTCNRLKSDAFTYEEFCLLSPILKIIQQNRKQSLWNKENMAGNLNFPTTETSNFNMSEA